MNCGRVSLSTRALFVCVACSVSCGVIGGRIMFRSWLSEDVNVVVGEDSWARLERDTPVEADGKLLLPLDIETTELAPCRGRIVSVQVAGASGVHVVPLIGSRRGNVERVARFLCVQRQRGALFIAHNAAFEYVWLDHHLGVVANRWFCTQVAEMLLTAGLDRQVSLAGTLERRLGVKLSKAVRRTFRDVSECDELTTEQIEYAADDVRYLLRLYKAQRALLIKERLVRIATLEFELMPVLARMGRRGVALDVELIKELLGREVNGVGVSGFLKERDKAEADFNEIFERPWREYKRREQALSSPSLFLFDVEKKKAARWNIRSTECVTEALRLQGLEVDSTSEESLIKLAQENEGVSHLLRFRKYDRLAQFCRQLLAHYCEACGVVHYSVRQCVNSGRMVYREPNLQQLPARDVDSAQIRSAIVPRKGCVFVGADYSGIELVIAAVLSGEKGIVDAVVAGCDVHALTISRMLNISYSEAVAQSFDAALVEDFNRRVPLPDLISAYQSGGVGAWYKTLRNYVKTLTYGTLYGMSAAGLSARWACDGATANALIELLRDAYPRLFRFLAAKGEEGARGGVVRTAMGRPRYFQKGFSARAKREAANHVIQGTCADALKLALRRFVNKAACAEINAYPVLAVHDEIIIESSEEDSSHARLLLREVMEEAMRDVLGADVVRVEPKMMKCWEK